jgi:mRNA-degrading endonuclease RelE of RelBE toxin-antitoxin system
MKTKVSVGQQALDFIGRQPPDAKRALRESLHEVESGKICPIPLEDELEGFYKVRVGAYRLILQSVPGQPGPGFLVVFAERRKFVYVLFAELLNLG